MFVPYIGTKLQLKKMHECQNGYELREIVVIDKHGKTFYYCMIIISSSSSSSNSCNKMYSKFHNLYADQVKIELEFFTKLHI